MPYNNLLEQNVINSFGTFPVNPAKRVQHDLFNMAIVGFSYFLQAGQNRPVVDLGEGQPRLCIASAVA